jgi:hypothetical protein
LAKYKKQFKIAIPTISFEKLEAKIQTNPPNFKYEKEGFYGIIYDITSEMTEYIDHMVPLSSRILQNKYGLNYRLMLDYLVENQIIIEDHQYSENHCRKFGLTNMSKDLKKMTTVLIDLKTSYGRYVKNRHNKEQREAKWKPLHLKALRNQFYKVEFNSESAINELNSIKEFITSEQYFAIYDDLLCLSRGNTNKRFFGQNKTNNRVDTNFTSLKAYFKKYIISDEILYQLDLNNSQPVLFNIVLNLIDKIINHEIDIKDITTTLCYGNTTLKHLLIQCSKGLMKDQKRVGLLKKEIEEYRYFTSNGKWYEHLVNVYNGYYETDYFDREKAKLMWMALAYSSNRSTNYYIVKLAFQDKYPIISLILRAIKKNKHAYLAIILQKIESHIFIEQISRNLIDNGIVPITIHDSVIVKKSDLEKSEEIMNQVLLENIGFTPKIQIENLMDSKFKIKQKPLDIAAEINQLHAKRNVNKLLLQKTG